MREPVILPRFLPVSAIRSGTFFLYLLLKGIAASGLSFTALAGIATFWSRLLATAAAFRGRLMFRIGGTADAAKVALKPWARLQSHWANHPNLNQW